MQFAAYVSGFAMLLVFWILYRLMSGNWDIGKLIEGADGKPSTSKLQWFLWTVVVLFSYVVIYAARAYGGDYAPISDVPQNLLIAMGISITSMVAAKGITSSYVNNGQLSKAPADPGSTGLSSVVKDDSGTPDLSKIQIMAWTLIAVVTYMIRVAQEIHAGSPLDLPDIDPALMVLMGLGHGAYLGKKLVTTSTPRLTGVSPGQGPSGSAVTLTGQSFGATQDGSLLTIDGIPIHPQGLTWGDTQITFQIPATQPNGTPWSQGQRVLVGITVNGQESANTLPFTVMDSGGQQGAVPPQQAVNPQSTGAFPTQVNPQITDASAGSQGAADASPTQVNPQITDSVTDTDAPPPGAFPTSVNSQITDS